MNNHSQKEWVCLRDAANNNLLVLYHLFGFFNKKGKKWVRVLDVKTLKDTLYLQFRFSTERLYYLYSFFCNGIMEAAKNQSEIHSIQNF